MAEKRIARKSLDSETRKTGSRIRKRVARRRDDLILDALERLLASSTKLGELNVKLATDTVAPITTKVSAAIQKVTARAA